MKSRSSYYFLNRSNEACPSFENANSLTQTQLFKRLTHPCRYDRIQRPERKCCSITYSLLTVIGYCIFFQQHAMKMEIFSLLMSTLVPMFIFYKILKLMIYNSRYKHCFNCDMLTRD